MIAMEAWKKLPVSLTELCIDTTLRCGQSFRWRQLTPNEWSMTLHGRILSFKQDESHLHYRAIFPAAALPTPPSSDANDSDDTLALVKHYFNLKPNLSALYANWAASDTNFRAKAPRFTGVRILQQDAWEALLGFICSSNNNISRISQMVHNLCRHYGPFLGHLGDEPMHDFPTPAELAVPGVEQRLRELGFGYRAKYIARTAQMVHERGLPWLNGLRNPAPPCTSISEAVEAGGRPGYREAHAALLELQGVGPKVADCVCLMGLGWGEAVPVDTHVWQIAVRDYKFGKGKQTSLTKATYDAVADKFRALWGMEAGWAQSVLFTANLRAFKGQLMKKEEVVQEETVVKVEDGGGKIMVKTEKRRVKRELEDEGIVDVKIETSTITRTKRRRRN
ncbi:mitochondrial glycosylase/lyase [Microthyrium microscopicum]|uniref:DNA-(apurinic or apyrimidinic site) lyase n=1 Tax=Microthyrium microscopicum TaxID=703497 RepID=A0A6A6UQG0_9PEZI|nr:mitochondrial glycosylase/lyase [Microthyrium microscopicum]